MSMLSSRSGGLQYQVRGFALLPLVSPSIKAGVRAIFVAITDSVGGSRRHKIMDKLWYNGSGSMAIWPAMMAPAGAFCAANAHRIGHGLRK
jgi:hypothetical protein